MNGAHIIFDSGTGIRGLGNDIARMHGDTPYEVHLLLSHTHWDHILGFPYFAPIHQPAAKITIYGPEHAGRSLESTIFALFQAPYFPLSATDIRAKVTFVELKKGQRDIQDCCSLKYAPHPHPNGALTYRLELDNRVITYVTDIEHTKDKLVQSVIDLGHKADVLIHDCHFNEDDLPKHRTWGHSSWEEAAQVAEEADVDKLFLFHFSPNYSDYDIFDMERLSQRRFPDTFAARQGMMIEIPAP